MAQDANLISNLPLTSPERAATYREMGIWRDQTVAEIFNQTVAKYPDKIAIIESGRQFTYLELQALTMNLASNLLDLGLKQGQIVAIQTPNAAEFPIVNIACSRVGLVFMPLHDSWREVEIRHLLQIAKVPLLIVPGIYRDFNHVTMMNEIRAELPDLQYVYALDGAHAGALDFAELLRPGARSAAGLSQYRPDADLPANVMLSGGTTSISKISLYSSNGYLTQVRNVAIAAEFGPEDICAALAPAGTGATGYSFPILMPLLYGATSVILGKWGDPDEAVKLLQTHKCTYAVVVPAQLTQMIPVLERHAPGDFAALRIFFCTGASLPFETGVKVERLVDCKILTAFGATDAGVVTVTSLADPQHARLRSVGKICPGFECELRDGAGAKSEPGQRGEIMWRGPDKSWGYLGPQQQFDAVFTDAGYYKSGDIGEFDADGYLYIVGRSKDMILRGARNIFPRTIEELIIQHPSVLDVSVAAMPDPILGERACAFVVLRTDHTLTFAALIEFLRAKKIAVWQLPERLEIYADLPRGAGGKVQKSVLTENITRKLRQEAGVAEA